MKKLLYMATLSLVATLMFASMAAAQEDPCPDPAFPRETPDGCQASDLPDVPAPGSTPTEPTPGATGEQYAPPETPAAPETPTATETPAAPETGTGAALPDTGGPAFLLPAAGLLLAGGLVGLRVARRK